MAIAARTGREPRFQGWLPGLLGLAAISTQLACGNNLNTSANPAVAGQPVTFTALVSGSPIPTGTVTFMDAGATLATKSLDTNGAATFTTSSLSVGTHPMTEHYAGDVANPPSDSNVVMQVINAVPIGFSLGTPCRAIDTRQAVGPYGGPALAANGDRTFVLAGQCGVPSGAVAVALNVTVAQATAAGDLRLSRAGSPLPPTSAINYKSGQTRANNAIVALGASGDFTVHCDQGSGTVQFIVDVSGYFQ